MGKARKEPLTTRFAAPPTYVAAASSSVHERAYAKVSLRRASKRSLSASDWGANDVPKEEEVR